MSLSAAMRSKKDSSKSSTESIDADDAEADEVGDA